MNFNTFFLDKLSSGSQSINHGSGKTALSSFLFSDIMKVCEQESGTNLKTQSDSVSLLSNPIEELPLSENVIECNDAKLKTLSDFIKSFIAGSKEPINVSELTHNLQPVMISKKQFLLSSNGMEDFIKGMVESINLNFSDDLKTPFSLIKEKSEELENLGTESKSNEKEILFLKNNSKEEVITDPSSLNSGTIIQSILDFLSNSKSLSLSFKSNLEKVNINIYELPEDNFETKINLEKLASDFIKEGKKIGDTTFVSSNEIVSEELGGSSVPNLTENKPAEYFKSSSKGADLLLDEFSPGVVNSEISLMPSGLNASNYENIYKTEIIEIAYKPNVPSHNISATIPSNAGKLSLDSSMSSGFLSNDSEISDVKFRLNNNLSMQLNIDASLYKNNLGSTSSAKPEASLSNSLFIQQTSPVIKVTDADNNTILSALVKNKNISETVLTQDSKATPLKIELPLSMNQNKEEVVANGNQGKAAISKSNEKPGDVNNTKVLLNELNGKLVGVEFKKAVAKDENVTITKDTVSTKQLSAEAVNDGKAIFNKTVNESSDEKDFAKYKTNDNLKGLPQSADLSAGTSEIDDKKILFTDLNGKLVGVDVKKTTAKENNAKAIKENENTKLVSGDNAKENETAIKETENNSSDRKDSAKHKSNESFKNILQSADQINGNDSDKFKIAPELKTSPDVPKTIKTHEIIPEFTKIIRTGEKQSMTFQLTPENLGKVKLIVEMIDNHINTRIEVENEQVKQFIQSNVEQLKQNLQSSGIQLSSVNISLTESEQKFSKAFSQRKKSGERVSKVKINDEQARPTQKSLGYNTYEFLA